jgi:hypothetical protein
MQMVRRLAGLLAVLTAFVVLPASAYGTPVRAAAAAADACPGSNYPVVPGATVQASTTRPKVGQHIEASGIHYCPNEDVRVTIAGKFVGTGHTDNNGSWDPEVVVPGPPGDKPLCGIGASGLPNDADCLTLTVQGNGVNPQPPASTGVAVASLIAIAGILLVSGIVFVRAGRRRQPSSIG